QMPALLEQGGKLRNLHKTVLAGSGFQDIQAYRKFRIARLDDNHSRAQIFSAFLLSLRKQLKQHGGGITMQVKEQKSATFGNVLGSQKAKERALSCTCAAQDGHMLSSLELCDDQFGSSHLFVDH